MDGTGHRKRRGSQVPSASLEKPDRGTARMKMPRLPDVDDTEGPHRGEDRTQGGGTRPKRTPRKKTVPAGRTRRAAAYRKRTKDRNPRRRLEGILSFVLAFVAGFSGVMCLSIAWRSVRTARLNREIARLHAAYAAEPADEPEQALMPELSGEPSGEEPARQEEAEPTAEGAGDAAKEGDPGTAVQAALQDPPEAAGKSAVSGLQPNPAGETVRTAQYHRDTGEALPEMARLRQENSDLVGWLSIDGVLDLPVVYRDNSYYLTHDFHKQENTAGTIFLDVNHRFSARACNLLLHGHNMKDGSMFGHLIRYQDIDYLKRHPVIEFSTLWQKERYVIISVMKVSLNSRDPSFFNYFSYPSFKKDEEYERYVRGAQLASLYAIPVTAEPSDALLTLSTCVDDDRLVILARRFHGGETVSEMRSLVSTAARQ